MVGEFVDAEERPAALAQVLDGEAEHGREDEQGIGHDTGVAVRLGVGRIVVVRIEVQRQRREERAFRLGDRAAPMVPEHAADLEILIAVALGHQPGAGPEIL